MAGRASTLPYPKHIIRDAFVQELANPTHPSDLIKAMENVFVELESFLPDAEWEIASNFDATIGSFDPSEGVTRELAKKLEILRRQKVRLVELDRLRVLRDGDGVAEDRKAIELKPGQTGRVVGHYNLGVDLHETGQLDEAIAKFRHAIELRPNLVDAHHILGTALYEKRQTERLHSPDESYEDRESSVRRLT